MYRFGSRSEQWRRGRDRLQQHCDIGFDQAVQDIESEEFGAVVAPNAQYWDEQDKEIGSKASELFGCFDPGKNKQHAEYGLINDIGIPGGAKKVQLFDYL